MNLNRSIMRAIVSAMGTTVHGNHGEVSLPTWREDAARIVEGLFAGASAEVWDLLLDLREGLLRGHDWNRTLDLFLACRERLEADQYLPFYRLRRLLAGSLRLAVVCGADEAEVASLTEVLRRPHRSLAALQRAIRREWFEHALDVSEPEKIGLQVVEK